MEPWHLDDQATIYHGDCREVLAELPDASVDSVVTDPPYELGFMGKRWDASGIAYDEGLWAECLRVLKPGGHLLAFGGTRTWHRLAVAIEDAGFEIRDSIAWMYGSGFPKSLDVSKAIDKQRDDRAAVRAVAVQLRKALEHSGRKRSDIDAYFGTANVSQYWFSPDRNAQVPPADRWPWLRDFLGLGNELDDEVWRLNGRKGTPGEAWQRAKVISIDERWNEPSGIVNVNQGEREKVERQIKAPATPDAARWQGWGTALKPAHEPVVVARKPLTGTVAANVLEHGTGALNIDGCRIGETVETWPKSRNYSAKEMSRPGSTMSPDAQTQMTGPTPAGRWPANVVLDDDQAAALDKQSGNRPGFSTQRDLKDGRGAVNGIYGAGMGAFPAGVREGYNDTGGASRFFYVAKAPARERPKVDGIAHPTVKPLTLMRWLCRLVTPPGGVVLEPFAGSGTTVEAALMEGFRVVAIEREPDYLPLIAARLERVAQEPDDGQLTFDASA